MTTFPARLRVLLSCFVLAACADAADTGVTNDGDTPGTHIDAFAVAGTQLAVLDAHEDELLRVELDTRSSTLRPVHLALPARPARLLVRAGDTPEWLVLCEGLRGVDAPPQLFAVDRRGKHRAYRLAAPYTTIEQTADGRYAVLRFEQGAQGGAFPSAQVAVVDLSSTDAVSETVVEIRGAAASDVAIAPPVRLGRSLRHFALWSGPQELALLDLAAPEVAPLRVELTGDRTRAARVIDTAFNVARDRIAVLAEDLDDVTLLELKADPDAERGYAVDVASLPVGTAPSAVAFTDLGSLLVLTDEGRSLMTIDAKTGTARTHALDARAEALSTCADCDYALLHAPLASRVTLVALDLAVAGEPGALRTLLVGAPVTEVRVEAAARHARLLHDAGALTWVDLTTGAVVPLGVSAAVARSAVGGGDGALWLAPVGGAVLTHYDAVAPALTEILLHAPIAGFALAPDAGVAVVLHAADPLALTMVPDIEPAFETARYLRSTAP